MRSIDNVYSPWQQSNNKGTVKKKEKEFN